MTTPREPALQVLTVPAPGGPLTVVLTPDDAVIRAAGYGEAGTLIGRLEPDLLTRGTAMQSHGRAASAARDAFSAYHDGDLAALDGLEVSQPGGPFSLAVWEAMRSIPAGTTASYAQLAAAAGRPSAIRAAASACARNLVAVVVPCHRVVRTDGTLGGYRYGLGTKQALLAHESAH